MHPLSLPFLHGLRDEALLVLRVVAGGIIGYHGWLHIAGGLDGFGGFIATLGVPAPTLVAYLVTGLELAGGILLAVGGLTRVVAVLLALEMIGTTLLVKVDVGLFAQGGTGAEIDLALLAAFVGLAILGPGLLSVDRAVGIEARQSARAGGRQPVPAR
jgi:putative oxidoreductase